MGHCQQQTVQNVNKGNKKMTVNTTTQITSQRQVDLKQWANAFNVKFWQKPKTKHNTCSLLCSTTFTLCHSDFKLIKYDKHSANDRSNPQTSNPTNVILTVSFFGWIVASLAAEAIPVFFAACAISFCSFSSCACTSVNIISMVVRDEKDLQNCWQEESSLQTDNSKCCYISESKF